MMGWQWHQLHHMQIICTLLQTDNHASNAILPHVASKMLSLHLNKTGMLMSSTQQAALASNS